MKTRRPTSQEIAELVSFLPRLYGDGFEAIKNWHGETEIEEGVFSPPWPRYDAVVDEFFRVASKECWCDYDYRPQDAGRMIEDADFIQTADLAQIKTMLTFVVRGERFCDGHWGTMIKGGHIRRLLERLAELGTVSA